MCGASGFLLNVDVEGVELKVCNNCKRYGTIKKSFSSPNRSYKKSFKKQEAPFFDATGAHAGT